MPAGSSALGGPRFHYYGAPTLESVPSKGIEPPCRSAGSEWGSAHWLVRRTRQSQEIRKVSLDSDSSLEGPDRGRRGFLGASGRAGASRTDHLHSRVERRTSRTSSRIAETGWTSADQV